MGHSNKSLVHKLLLIILCVSLSAACSGTVIVDGSSPNAAKAEEVNSSNENYSETLEIATSGPILSPRFILQNILVIVPDGSAPIIPTNMATFRYGVPISWRGVQGGRGAVDLAGRDYQALQVFWEMFDNGAAGQAGPISGFAPVASDGSFSAVAAASGPMTHGTIQITLQSVDTEDIFDTATLVY